MSSLERRLQLGITLSLVLLMGLVWVIGNQSLRSLTEDFVVSRLEHDAESLLAALELNELNAIVRKRRINPIFHQPFSGHYYVVQFADGSEISSRSLWDQSLSVPILNRGQVIRLRVEGPDNQKLLLWAKGFHKSGKDFTLGIAEDLTPIEPQRERFKRFFIMLTAAGLLVLLLLQGLLLRSSFRRLDFVREEIRQLEQGKREKLSEDVPGEIAPLVREFNQLLNLLAQRLDRSRNALGNLAHALKGPLNLLTQFFDTELNEVNRTSWLQAKDQTSRLRELIERELKRARLAGTGGSTIRFNASEELWDLAELLKRVHGKPELHIEIMTADDLPVFGDREDMLELIGNLMDNACKWAKSKVSCEISGAAEITILIEDDGPGLKDRDLQQIIERGTRLDESVTGHGLGLAIVKDIVELYNGKIKFDKSEGLGGLRVAVLLPPG